MSRAAPPPPRAYVPGVSERHAEGYFDEIRDTARPGMSAENLAECAAWRTGLRYYLEGFYWEAHEVLEPVWMALPPNGAERRLAQALIQLCNAKLKLRMDRPGAARRLAAIAADLVQEAGGDALMGLERGWLRAEIAMVERAAAPPESGENDAL